jgi:hypothetical protein
VVAPDPFDTKKLAKTRARQRQMLRKVDGGVVRRVGKHVSTLGVPSDQGLVETTLRSLADKEAKAVDPVVKAMSAIEVAELMVPLLEPLFRDESRKQLEDGVAYPDLTPVLQEYRKLTGNPAAGLDEAFDSVVRMVALLLWADQLADDKYSDPRLEGNA